MKKPAKKKPLKAKKCKVCLEPFQPFQGLQIVCSPKCANDYVTQQKAKKYKVETRKRRQELKTNGELLKEAQREFNKFIRLRDHDQPCISCGRTQVEWTRGGRWDCGHYKSAGAYPELRFEELNAHKQCKSCNSGSHWHVKKSRSTETEYRENLIKKIGLEKVEWLEGPHKPKKYKREEILQIKSKYAKKARELEKLITP